jgi:hypothetical protein
MLTKTFTILLFVSIMSLLIGLRFISTPPQLPVRIAAGSGEDAGYGFGAGFRRGSVVETGDGYLKLTIGEETELDQEPIVIWMAEQTTLELDRLFEDEITLRLTRGRIIISNIGDVPVTLDTNHTSHKILDDVASFINYDFLETIHVIPLSGSVQVYIQQSGESLLTPTPLSIHETEPVEFQLLSVNLHAGDSTAFYQWAGFLAQQ